MQLCDCYTFFSSTYCLNLSTVHELHSAKSVSIALNYSLCLVCVVAFSYLINHNEKEHDLPNIMKIVLKTSCCLQFSYCFHFFSNAFNNINKKSQILLSCILSMIFFVVSPYPSFLQLLLSILGITSFPRTFLIFCCF